MQSSMAMDFDVEQLFELDPQPLHHHHQQQQQQEVQQQQFRNRASTWDPSFKRPKLPSVQSVDPSPAGLYVNCQSPMQFGDLPDDVAMLPAAAAGPASGCQECYLSVPSASGSTLSPGLTSPASQLSAPGGLSPANLSPHSLQQQQQQQQQQQKRRNAWGSQSYAELITQAIESHPQGRLTLSEIYDWMIKNIPYFGSRSDSASSAGWKNSVRHNLSLHNKFVRVQNDQTGKSSYWTVNYEAKERHATAGAASSAAGSTSASVVGGGGGGAFRRRAATADAPRSVDLQSKRAAVLARRAAAAASAVNSTPSQPQPPPPPPPPPPFTVAEVMRDLVPPDQLLNGEVDTEQLLFESLTDAVLNGGPTAGSDPPVQSLTQQMNHLTCQQQQQQQQLQQQSLLSNSSGIGGSWFDSTGDVNSLPDILEAVDALEQQPPQQQQQQPQQSFAPGLQFQQYQNHAGYIYEPQQPALAPHHQQQQQQQQQQQCNCGVDFLMQEQA